MGKLILTTPRSRVRQAIRLLWLHSRERAATLKRDGYKCGICNIKQSKRKGAIVQVEVHHVHEIPWEHIIDEIYEHILVNPKYLQTLCKSCHAKKEKL